MWLCSRKKQKLDIVQRAGVVVALVLTYALTLTLLPNPRQRPSATTGKITTNTTTPSADDTLASSSIEQPGGPVVQVVFPDLLPAFISRFAGDSFVCQLSRSNQSLSLLPKC